jgi:hypothetical protein
MSAQIQIQSAKVQFAFPLAIAKNNKQFNFKFCKERLEVFNSTLFTAISQAVADEKFTLEFFEGLMQETIKSTYVSPSKPKKEESDEKKPLYGFMAYCMKFRAQVKAENPELKSNEINKHLGAMWNDLSDEEKLPFAAPPKEKKEKVAKPAKAAPKAAPKPKKAASIKSASIKSESESELSDSESEEKIATSPKAPKEKVAKPAKPAKAPKAPKAPKEKVPKEKEAKLTKTFEKECINAICANFNTAISKAASHQFEDEKEQEEARTKATKLFLLASKKAKGSFANLWQALAEIATEQPEKFAEINTLFEEEPSIDNEYWNTQINIYQNHVLELLLTFIEEQIIKHIEEVKEKPSNDLLYYHLVGLYNHLQTLGYTGPSINEIIKETCM